ncbi:MAG: hypothetical protein ABIH82_03755 [Candidatus Woesearchaeota archaeon]
MGITKYFEIGKLTFFNSFVYIIDFLATSIFIAVIIFILTNLWKVVFSGSTGVIEGFTIGMMIWYLVMTESLVISPGRVVEEIGDEIQSGDIAQYLNKPYNYFMFKYASNMGSTLIKFLLTFVIGGIVALIFVGTLEFNLIYLPIILILVFLALTLNFLIMGLLGIFALWLEDSKGIYFVYTKIVFVIGGMLLPLDLFPTGLAKISKLLPFSYIAYHPAKTFVMFSWQQAINTIIGQIIWIIIFLLILALFYKIIIRKICINGG